MKNNRAKKQRAIDLVPKHVMAEARNVVFSYPELSYEAQLRKLDERVDQISGMIVINPRHISMALDEARKAF